VTWGDFDHTLDGLDGLDELDGLDGLDDLVGSALDGLDERNGLVDAIAPSADAIDPIASTTGAYADDGPTPRPNAPPTDTPFESLGDDLGILLDNAFDDLGEASPERESARSPGPAHDDEPPALPTNVATRFISPTALATADEAPLTPREPRPFDAFDAPTRVAFAAVALPDDEEPPSSMRAPSTGLRLGPRTPLNPPASTRPSPPTRPTDEPDDDDR
jgi:hypothetical protein